ncbi:MAG: DUF885 family protein, partial [Novosphingobium sp.]
MVLRSSGVLLFAAFLTVAPAPAIPQPQPRAISTEIAGSAAQPHSEDARLVALFADDARRTDALDPLDQLSRGETVAPRQLELIFTDTLSRRRLAATQQSLAALARIDRAKLSPARQISYDAFAWNKRDELNWLQPDIRMLTDVQPLNHFDGLQVTFPSLMSQGGTLPYETEADYRNALGLQGAIGPVFDQAILRFREGIASGVVEPRLTVRNMIGQIDALLAQPIAQSPFYSPVRNFPKGVPASARAKLQADYAAMLRDAVYPAYRRLRAFLNEEYLPASRTSAGLSEMKGGAELYRRLLREHTSLKLDPAQVHRLGLGEVARIQAEMSGVQRKLGYDGTLRAFFDTIRTDPKFHPKSEEELAAGFARVARAVDAQVPHYFARVPKAKLVIQPYPAYREKYEAGGSYNQGSADANRPGIFFFNAYDLKSRDLSGITTLFLHEGIPGQHFQVSRAQ